MADRNGILMIAPEIVTGDSPWEGSRRMHYLGDMLEKNGENVVALFPECSEPSGFLGRTDKRRLKDFHESVWECIRKNEVKKIIIGGSGLELFPIAKTVKEKDESIKIVFDCSEPWNLRKGMKNPAYLKDKECLQYADCIVCCSETLRTDMCEAFEINRNKTAVVYTGYAEEAWRKAEGNKGKSEPEKKRLTITYVGKTGLDSSRKNCRSYRGLNALMSMVEKQPGDIVELKLVDLGCMANVKRRNNIKYIGKSTQEEAFHYMLESDVLLNMQDTDDNYDKYLVPGEFYDYMRSGKAIWSIGRYDGLAAKLLVEYDMGITCEDDEERIEEVLEGLVSWKRRGRIGELRKGGGKDITGFARERQIGKYLEALGRL